MHEEPAAQSPFVTQCSPELAVAAGQVVPLHAMLTQLSPDVQGSPVSIEQEPLAHSMCAGEVPQSLGAVHGLPMPDSAQ
jgi:hypothetical protein